MKENVYCAVRTEYLTKTGYVYFDVLLTVHCSNDQIWFQLLHKPTNRTVVIRDDIEPVVVYM